MLSFQDHAWPPDFTFFAYCFLGDIPDGFAVEDLLDLRGKALGINGLPQKPIEPVRSNSSHFTDMDRARNNGHMRELRVISQNFENLIPVVVRHFHIKKDHVNSAERNKFVKQGGSTLKSNALNVFQLQQLNDHAEIEEIVVNH
jgi:hypothetical protein